MEHILPSYNDPLFSILLIIILGIIITLATSGWSFYKQQKEQNHLLKFLDQFDSSECALDTHNMPYEPHLLKPLSLLAKAFENTGEYHKAISIYVYLIKNISKNIHKLELLERLGYTYFHAGFIERAKTIFIDILRKMPRNTKILYSLGIIYEMMHEYALAKEVIEPLELLNVDTFAFKNFLNFSELSHNQEMQTKEKITAFKELLKEEPKLYRKVIALMFTLDTEEAWKMIDTQRIQEVLDILWALPKSQLDLDIIASNNTLSAIYIAKGYLPKALDKHSESGIFALDVLAITKQNGFKKADLHFSYLCQKCKQNFPANFIRCPNCMAIHSVKVKESIGKAYEKTDYSLL